METRETGVSQHRQAPGYVAALRYDFLTSIYDPIVALTTRERTFKERLLSQACIDDGANVLDLGCGTGTLAIRAKRLHPGATIVGIDGDPKVLSIARRKAEAAGAHVRLDTGLSFDLPYTDARFDRVVSSLFFHHLTTADKRRTILEVHRVLVPGGQFHVADWGRPNGPLMRMLFYPVRLLDGFETTRDNVRGRLPELFAAGGFEDARLRGELNTMMGTLAFYSATRPD
ncbi:MAG: class I SAM-dependent methyltransferase [Acidobacteria bacterium]|nr:MAG: class I SAM-dependent methyltransferase [Acidobacteriota bacterium]